MNNRLRTHARPLTKGKVKALARRKAARESQPTERHYVLGRFEDETLDHYRSRRAISNSITKQLNKGTVVKPMPPSVRRLQAEYLQQKKLFKRGTFVPQRGSELELHLYKDVYGMSPPLPGKYDPVPQETSCE